MHKGACGDDFDDFVAEVAGEEVCVEPGFEEADRR